MKPMRCFGDILSFNCHATPRTILFLDYLFAVETLVTFRISHANTPYTAKCPLDNRNLPPRLDITSCIVNQDASPLSLDAITAAAVPPATD
jgi:hypothetical protein